MERDKNKLFLKARLTVQTLVFLFSLWSALPKCLVNGPKPTGVTAGTEQDEPQETKPEVNCTSSPCHPGYARHQVNAECNRVHYEDKNVSHQTRFYTDVYDLFWLCIYMKPVACMKPIPLTDPKLVNSVNNLGVRLGDFLIDILVETRLNAQKLGQRRKVVDSL